MRRIYPRPGLSLTMGGAAFLMGIGGTWAMIRGVAQDPMAMVLTAASSVVVYGMVWLAWWQHIACSAKGVSLAGFRRQWLSWSEITGVEAAREELPDATPIRARTVMGEARTVTVVPYQPIFFDTQNSHEQAVERTLVALEEAREIWSKT